MRFSIRAVVVLILAVLILCGSLYYRILTFEGRSEASLPAAGADAGIVLGASLWNDTPSPGLRERLDHALKLYRAGVFPRIIVTGGLDAGGATITEAEGMRNFLIGQGVPEKAVFLDRESRSTYENLQFAKRIMDGNGWKMAVIVTHRYHGARAEDIADTLGYEFPAVSVTDSRVMNIPYHQMRETLAFVKWQMNKLVMAFG